MTFASSHYSITALTNLLTTLEKNLNCGRYVSNTDEKIGLIKQTAVYMAPSRIQDTQVTEGKIIKKS
jgi:hypothetical protein